MNMSNNAYKANTNTMLQRAVASSNIADGIIAGAANLPTVKELNWDSLGLNEAEHGAVVAELAQQILNDNNFEASRYGYTDENSEKITDELLGAIQASSVTDPSAKILEIVKVTQEFSANTINANSGGLIKRIFRKGAMKIEEQRRKYDTVSERIGNIQDDINGQMNDVTKTTQVIARLQQQNQEQLHTTSLRIAAGRMALNTFLGEMHAIDENGNVTVVYDFEKIQTLHVLERRLEDLEISQVHRQQQEVQYQMMIATNRDLTEKFKSVNSMMIPAWRQGITMAMGIQRTQQAAQLMNTITDVTNQFMKENARMQGNATIEVARLAQRSLIDVSTIEDVQKTLQNTASQVLAIQREGAASRKANMEKVRSLQTDIESLVHSEAKIALERIVAPQHNDDKLMKQVKEASQ